MGAYSGDGHLFKGDPYLLLLYLSWVLIREGCLLEGVLHGSASELDLCFRFL